MTTPMPVPTPADWDAWLRTHHATLPEVWLRLYRKRSGTLSITWDEGVVGALCWGWIDGLKRPLDDISWLQPFTPRRLRSIWSAHNRTHAERRMTQGHMQPPGLVQVQSAQADGRWDAAYAGATAAQVPPDFLAALAADPAAPAFYATLNAANRDVIYHRLHTAKKPETRAKRMATHLAMMARGEVFS